MAWMYSVRITPHRMARAYVTISTCSGLARLVAHADRIRGHLGWQPQYEDLDEIVRTAIAWEKHRRY